MSDFLDPENSYNPWDLKELKYEGELYHYTYVDACRGIFCHTDCPNYPSNSISLRFKRIDQMAQKNDPNERKHINHAIKKLARQLFKHGKISEDFLKIICDYEPTGRGLYRLALDKKDTQFCEPIVQTEFGPVDYYVACFSTNPNNEHIVKEFKTSVRITFNSEFSRRCTDPFSRASFQVGSSGRVFDCSNSIYPLDSIRKCLLDTYLRQVEYVDTSADENDIKSELIEQKLLNIFEQHQNKLRTETVQEEIEDMYSLCDAFIKDISYKLEEEVRFVIRLPEKEYFLKKYGQFPKLLTDNYFVFDKAWTYLQLPISEEFVAL